MGRWFVEALRCHAGHGLTHLGHGLTQLPVHSPIRKGPTRAYWRPKITPCLPQNKITAQ
jgi:hypothetical protein